MGMDPIWYPRLIRPAEMAMEKKEESRIEENPLGRKPVAESDSDFYFLFLDILVEHLRRNFSAWWLAPANFWISNLAPARWYCSTTGIICLPLEVLTRRRMGAMLQLKVRSVNTLQRSIHNCIHHTPRVCALVIGRVTKTTNYPCLWYFELQQHLWPRLGEAATMR